jgi:hypothetical protein
MFDLVFEFDDKCMYLVLLKFSDNELNMKYLFVFSSIILKPLHVPPNQNWNIVYWCHQHTKMFLIFYFLNSANH